jgi:hypothetical protein
MSLREHVSESKGPVEAMDIVPRTDAHNKNLAVQKPSQSNGTGNRNSHALVSHSPLSQSTTLGSCSRGVVLFSLRGISRGHSAVLGVAKALCKSSQRHLVGVTPLSHMPSHILMPAWSPPKLNTWPQLQNKPCAPSSFLGGNFAAVHRLSAK